MKRLMVALIAAFWLVNMTAVSAAAPVPALPQSFFGEVRIDGVLAQVGTRVEARGTGVLTDIPGNPIITTQIGLYGGQGSFDPKLVVQGAITEGATLSFFVNGKAATQTATWMSGQVTRLDLTMTPGAAPPPPPPPAGGAGGGGGGASVGGGGTGSTTVALTGVTGVAPTLDNRGKTQGATRLKTADNKVDINIAAATEMTNKAGQPIATLSAAPLVTPPAPPPSGSIVLAYEFGPTGAQFNPPINMTLSFNPATVPARVPVDKLFIAWWDASASKWQKLASTVDPVNNTVTARVSHFTEFAILAEPEAAPPPAPPPAPAPAPAPSPTPTPPTIRPEPTPQVTPTPTPAIPAPPASPAAPPPPAPAPASGINWTQVAGAIALALLIAVFVFLAAHWRRAA